MARKRRSFTPEYQAEVVGLIRDDGKARTAVARDLGLTDSAVRRRVERSEVDAGRGTPQVLITVEPDELSPLRRENRQLCMEREILKKLTHFFAKQSTWDIDSSHRCAERVQSVPWRSLSKPPTKPLWQSAGAS